MFKIDPRYLPLYQGQGEKLCRVMSGIGTVCVETHIRTSGKFPLL